MKHRYGGQILEWQGGLRFTLRVSAAAGAFLAFGWPALVSADPASPAFRVVAVTTLVVFLASLGAACALRARKAGD